MKKYSLVWRLTAICLAVLLALPVPGYGFMDSLSVEKEKQIGEEFTQQLQQYYHVIGDPYLTSYINRVGRRLVNQLGPTPYNFRFFILEDPTTNAFAVPGGYIFVTTGFIRAMEREGELAGVLSHEISHIYARHLARQMDKSRVVTIASVLGALASVFLGVGPLAQSLMVGSVAAGESAMLKYSREHEHEADSLGFKWMVKAGYNPRDMMSIFQKLGRRRWFEGGEIPVYLSTHPHTDSRIVDFSHQLSSYQGNLPPEQDPEEFHYFALKLEALTGNAAALLRRMTQESLRDPDNPRYHYGKALALSKMSRYDEADVEFNKALSLSPGNFLIERDLAIHYFNQNHFAEAQKNLERLMGAHPQDEAVLYYLGRIYQEKKQTDQALNLLEKVHNLNPTFIDVYYNLGTLYGEKGRIGLAHYYLGFHSLKAKAYPLALFHFRKAMPNLASSDPRYNEVRQQIARLTKMKVRVAN
ncbi:MAG: M48 family metalloprotease [Deltaproteobacteria bacterium]|nr:M48 family metalloprotease [Deltaproteobacteria bacterium]